MMVKMTNYYKVVRYSKDLEIDSRDGETVYI